MPLRKLIAGGVTPTVLPRDVWMGGLSMPLALSTLSYDTGCCKRNGNPATDSTKSPYELTMTSATPRRLQCPAA